MAISNTENSTLSMATSNTGFSRTSHPLNNATHHSSVMNYNASIKNSFQNKTAHVKQTGMQMLTQSSFDLVNSLKTSLNNLYFYLTSYGEQPTEKENKAIKHSERQEKIKNETRKRREIKGTDRLQARFFDPDGISTQVIEDTLLEPMDNSVYINPKLTLVEMRKVKEYMGIFVSDVDNKEEFVKRFIEVCKLSSPRNGFFQEVSMQIVESKSVISLINRNIQKAISAGVGNSDELIWRFEMLMDDGEYFSQNTLYKAMKSFNRGDYISSATQFMKLDLSQRNLFLDMLEKDGDRIIRLFSQHLEYVTIIVIRQTEVKILVKSRVLASLRESKKIADQRKKRDINDKYIEDKYKDAMKNPAASCLVVESQGAVNNENEAPSECTSKKKYFNRCSRDIALSGISSREKKDRTNRSELRQHPTILKPLTSFSGHLLHPVFSSAPITGKDLPYNPREYDGLTYKTNLSQVTVQQRDEAYMTRHDQDNEVRTARGLPLNRLSHHCTASISWSAARSFIEHNGGIHHMLSFVMHFGSGPRKQTSSKLEYLSHDTATDMLSFSFDVYDSQFPFAESPITLLEETKAVSRDRARGVRLTW